MTLLLTILSVLAAWTFLGVLAVGLLVIRKVLESVRLYLEKIAMGVRAIERQTSEVSDHAANVDRALADASEPLAALGPRFEETARLLRGTPS